MRPRLTFLFPVVAVAALSAAVLAPVAGASTNAGGMMGAGVATHMPTPWPTTSGMPWPNPSATPSTIPSGTPTPDPSPSSTPPSGAWCGGGIWNGSGSSWGGTGMWGTGSGAGWLTSDPAALQAWLQLRADHVKAMQTWYDTYKADLTTPAAQQALHDLWTTFWNDMKAFYEQYGNGAAWTCPSSGMWSGWMGGGMMGGGSWNPSHMWGSGYGAAWMTSHPGGLGQWLAMRGRQTADATAWQHKYSAAPGSAAARSALRTMNSRHTTQVRSFYTHHHLTPTSSLMRSGAGGWMGLGGMWGGFGW